MPRSLLMEEFHVTVRAPANLSKSEYVVIRRTLGSKRFQGRLREAIRALVCRHTSLKHTQVSLNR